MNQEIWHYRYVDHLPKGRMWEAYGVEGTPDYAVAGGISAVIEGIDEYIKYFKSELNPYETVDLIDDHEKSAGLPDACSINSNLTLEQRRLNVILRTRKTPIVNVEEMQELVKEIAGVDLRIIPRWTGFDLGGFDAYDFGTDETERFIIDVYADFDKDIGFDLDVWSVFDGPQFPRIIECLIEKIKPGNVLAVYHYEKFEDLTL